MLDIQEIEDTISDLENSDTTLENCRILADMYIIRDTYSRRNSNTVEKELNDILPQYRRYRDIKRKYQLQEVTESAVINSIYNVCKELKEFIQTLYSSTDTQAERDAIVSMIKQLNI